MSENAPDVRPSSHDGSPERARGDLPDDDCLTSLHALVGFVDRTCGDFLAEAEWRWLAAFRGCAEPAQRLHVRLIGRRASIFRVERLRYVEIADIAAAAAELAGHGLADARENTTGLPDRVRFPDAGDS